MSKMRLLTVAVIAFVVVGLFHAASSNARRSVSLAGQSPGAMELAVMPDQQQFTNPAVPVFVVRTVSGLSEPNAEAKKQYLIKEVILENRSTKDISSVTVRWVITPLNSRTTALARGKFSPHVLQSLHKTFLAGHRQTLKLSHPKLSKLIQQIPHLEAMGNKFVFIIGVAEVTFEDGSSWTEELTDVSNKSPANN